jgi:hypothetical protein
VAAGVVASKRQERVAFQMPEQMPEGPVPAHVPVPANALLSRSRPNRPVPLVLRGPATAFILTCPEAEMRPAT